jgi:1-acyl-sn-glycerol-3-phosphate acyltransferase
MAEGRITHDAPWMLPCRKGFVRIALQTGADLVPVYTFGENDVVSVVDVSKVSWARHLQRAFKKVGGFTLPFVYGRGMFGLPFGLLPYQVPITAVVGSPIEVPLFAGAPSSWKPDE